MAARELEGIKEFGINHIVQELSSELIERVRGIGIFSFVPAFLSKGTQNFGYTKVRDV